VKLTSLKYVPRPVAFVKGGLFIFNVEARSHGVLGLIVLYNIDFPKVPFVIKRLLVVTIPLFRLLTIPLLRFAPPDAPRKYIYDGEDMISVLSVLTSISAPISVCDPIIAPPMFTIFAFFKEACMPLLRNTDVYTATVLA
jgi:hypothetical protein